MRRILERLRADDGIFFLAPLIPYAATAAMALTVGTVGIAFGQKANTAVSNTYVIAAAQDLETQMAYVEQKTAAGTDPRSIEANRKAREVREIAKKLQTTAFEETIITNEETNKSIAIDIGTALVGGTIDHIATGKTVVLDVGGMTLERVVQPETAPEQAKLIQQINDVRFRVTERQLANGGVVGMGPVPEDLIEAAIYETKLDDLASQVTAATGIKGDEARQMAEVMLFNMEADTPESEMDLPLDDIKGAADQEAAWRESLESQEYRESRGLSQEALEDPVITLEEMERERAEATAYYRDAAEVQIASVDPSKAKGRDGDLKVSNRDKEQLEDGIVESVVGTVITPMGPEPVIVSSAGEERYKVDVVNPGKGTSDMTVGRDFKIPEKVWKSWWDGTYASCPFLYAFDGSAMRRVNDIISVSRDPQREYEDFMLFPAEPRPDNTMEFRIEEIRAEESFLDRVAFHAVDVPPGLEAAVTPDGRALSVGPARPPVAAVGAPLTALSSADGIGFAAFAGSALTATFASPGSDAVLLMTLDGFEQDAADAGMPLHQRPALTVEALEGGEWVPAGVVHPREYTYTAALDLAPFVENGRATVRIRATSCHENRYQLIDSVMLSSAPSDLATMRPLATTLDAAIPGAAELLARRDDRRVHLTPGQTLTFRARNAKASAYVVESLGWYRPLVAAE